MFHGKNGRESVTSQMSNNR